jgi:hypothetical protein
VLSSSNDGRIVLDPRSFITTDGRLDFPLLLEEFVGFWRQNGEVLVNASTNYPEAAPLLVMMAYLQRVVNGGGQIEREYGTGRGRIDLMVRWPYQKGGKRSWQREAVELKVWRSGRPDPVGDGLRQLDEYLARLGLDHGTLVIFDQRPQAQPYPDRGQITSASTSTGRSITLLRA